MGDLNQNFITSGNATTLPVTIAPMDRISAGLDTQHTSASKYRFLNLQAELNLFIYSESYLMGIEAFRDWA